jgi:YgiT-type zinc finger domain-containing protein
MKCSITGCPGEYEPTTVVQTLRHDNRTVVIEDVPADVCSVCGDILFSAETVRSIEQLLSSPPEPARTVPAFNFSLGTTPGETAIG